MECEGCKKPRKLKNRSSYIVFGKVSKTRPNNAKLILYIDVDPYSASNGQMGLSGIEKSRKPKDRSPYIVFERCLKNSAKYCKTCPLYRRSTHPVHPTGRKDVEGCKRDSKTNGSFILYSFWGKLINLL